jgi:hypothetical protein
MPSNLAAASDYYRNSPSTQSQNNLTQESGERIYEQQTIHYSTLAGAFAGPGGPGHFWHHPHCLHR